MEGTIVEALPSVEITKPSDTPIRSNHTPLSEQLFDRRQKVEFDASDIDDEYVNDEKITKLKSLKKVAVVKAGRFPNIFHSDRGREYLSQNGISYLENNGSKISVSDPGSPWQNAWSESFFLRFKGENGDLSRFETLGEFIEYVFEYLNYYNNLRIYTTIKMLSI